MSADAGLGVGSGIQGQLTVRPAAPDDATALADLHVRSWQVGYAGLIDDELLASLDVAERTERWRGRLIADSGASTLVAVQGGQVAGFVSVGPYRPDDETVDGSPAAPLPPEVGELRSLYVDPEIWGGGVGSALLRAARAVLARDYQAAVLWVLDGNARACRVYEADGWRADGAVKVTQIGATAARELRYGRRLAERVGRA